MLCGVDIRGTNGISQQDNQNGELNTESELDVVLVDSAVVEEVESALLHVHGNGKQQECKQSNEENHGEELHRSNQIHMHEREL